MLGRMRCLLFPPESTSSPEKEAIGPSQGGVNSMYPSGALPSVSSPSAPSPRMFQGPSIREVQATVANLREASLCVVEAIQAWRRERQKELSRRQRGDDDTTNPQSAGVVSWGVSDDRAEAPPSESPDGPEQGSESNNGEMSPREASRGVRFPVVPTAQPVSAPDEDLPPFWWFPPATRGHQTGSDSSQPSRCTSLGPETSVPEQVGHDLNEEPPARATATLESHHRHSDGAVGKPTPAPASNASADPSSADQVPSSPHPWQARTASSVNYLACMATDTDFVGAPGSVLVDFFPPDTKLYRNPFVLGHNLDDTLVVFSASGGAGGGGSAAASPRDRGRQDGGVETSGSLPAALMKRRLDPRRVRLASAAIVAEDARERSGKRRGAEERGDQDACGEAAGEGEGGPSRSVAAEAEGCGGDYSSGRYDEQRFDRLDSGSSRSVDGEHGGGGNGSKKRREKGGIRFDDQQGEGGDSVVSNCWRVCRQISCVCVFSTRFLCLTSLGRNDVSHATGCVIQNGVALFGPALLFFRAFRNFPGAESTVLRSTFSPQRVCSPA